MSTSLVMSTESQPSRTDKVGFPVICSSDNITVSYIDDNLGASITNLNEPPRALATSTIMWVRASSIPFGPL